MKTSSILGSHAILALLLNACCFHGVGELDDAGSEADAGGGSCVIDGGAYARGEFINPNPWLCQQCNPTVSVVASTAAPLGSDCPISGPDGPNGRCAFLAGSEFCTCSLHGSVCDAQEIADGGIACCNGDCRGGRCCTNRAFAVCADGTWCCTIGVCCPNSDGGAGYCSPDGGC
jgi:hypothetical protein